MMNISFLPKLYLPFTSFRNQFFKCSLSERITAAVSTVFITLISLSLIGIFGIATYKFVKFKISNTKASQEFRKNIEEWKNDPTVKGDKETASIIILRAFDKKSKYLDLSDLSLNSIPEAIDKLTQLRDLNLSNNPLKSLPEAIGKLTQLTRLYLENNQLQSLSETIGNFTQLKSLSLSNNQLQSLPETIGNLTQLEFLNLSNNQLQSLPETIGNLTQLEFLFLENNQLTSVPETIGNLTQLKILYLSRNFLRALPQSISNLVTLGELDIRDNRDLAELPISLGQLVNLSSIECLGTLISRQTAQAILNLCRAKRDKKEDLIPRLKAWASINNYQALIDETKVEALEIKEKQTLNEWLKRLEQTKDYRQNQKSLAALVCQLIQTVLDKEEFKAVFMGQAEINNEDCQDRSAMNLNVIYLYWKLHFLPPEASLKDKLELLIKASKTLALRKNLEALVYAQELENGHKEEESVEIYLYYEMTLQEELNLLTASQTMDFSRVGKRNWIDLEELKASVQKDYLVELAKLDVFDQLAETDPCYAQEWQNLKNRYADLIEKDPSPKILIEREKAKIEMIQKWFKSLSL